jgi:predicted nucleic acid-binding protein
MKVMLDLNVVLDVVQRREPHYAASAQAMSSILDNGGVVYLASHALTTLHYIVTRYGGSKAADQLIDWALGRLEIAPQTRAEFLRARSLDFADFEDAALASAAEAARCEVILTRNVADFRGSPVRALTPEEFLAAV